MAGKEKEPPELSEGPQEEEEPKKRSKLPLLIGLVLVLLVNSLIIGKLMLGGKPSKRASVVEEVGAKIPLDEFLVNLAGSNDHYLKTTIAIGLKKGLTEESVKDDIPPIRDAILQVLTSKPLDDLATPAGKETLKREVKERINAEIGEGKVVKVYFMAFATQ